MPDRSVRMYNPTHRFETTAETAPTSDHTIAWSHEFQETAGSVAVWDESVYITVGRGVVAIGQDGTPQWRFQTNDRVYSSPAVVGGTVHVGSDDNHVYTLDATDGTERWAFETDGSVHSSPAVVDKTVYVGSRDGNVYALDAIIGAQQWAFETGGSGLSSPAVVDCTVCVGGINDTQVYALDATSGREQWAIETNALVDSSPAITNNRLASPPTVVGGTVYLAFQGGGGIYALGGAETEVYSETEKTGTDTRIYQACSSCGADLSEHGTLNFCPECGSEQ